MSKVKTIKILTKKKKKILEWTKWAFCHQQNSHAGPASLPLPSDPIKVSVSPHQHRHKSQRTICLSSSATLRLMLCPVESNLPKANISSSGGLTAYSTHPKAVPLFLISYSVWSTGTEESAKSFLMIWGHQLKTEAAREPSTVSLCNWVRKELHQKNSQSIIPFQSFHFHLLTLCSEQCFQIQTKNID